MPIPATIQRFLQDRGAAYDVVAHQRATEAMAAAHAAYIPLDQLVLATALRDRRGILVALLPAGRCLDTVELNRQLGRELEPMDVTDTESLFTDCEQGIVPALAGAYGIKSILDDTLPDEVYFRVTRQSLVHMTRKDLQQVQRAWRGYGLSYRDPEADAQQQPPDPRQRVAERVRGLHRLPAMPEMGQRILQLRANPYAGPAALAQIVELDPSLAAQVIRYARSPFFGYRGSVNSIHEAITRVLGYDVTLNIMLGIALARPFKIPRGGPAGLHAFWRHAVYGASLAQMLARSLPGSQRADPGLSYLAGMLHNIGLLLLGHVFPAEFYWLNRELSAAESESLTDVEQRLLGISHTELGGWLAEHWNLPAAVQVAVRHHHDLDYRGTQAVYAQLVMAANAILERAAIGDTRYNRFPSELVPELELTDNHAKQLLQNLLGGAENLDHMANQLAA